MRALARYAVAHAVTRALVGQLLTRPDWDALLRTPSAMDAWTQLRKTIYGEYLPEEVRSDPLAIEKELREVTASRYAHASRSASGQAGVVARILLSRWELDALEAGLRLWHARDLTLAGYIPRRPATFGFSLDLILGAENLEKVADSLIQTPYAAPLMACVRNYRTNPSVFDLELALERDYYRRLSEAVKALGGEDARMGMRMVTAEIDYINLSWLARMMIYHRVPVSQFPNLMIPCESKLARRFMAADFQPQDLTAMARGIVGARGNIDVSALAPMERVGLLETIAGEVAVDSARNSMAGFPFRITCLIAYALLLRLELRNLCGLFAGKAAGLNEAALASHLAGLR